MSQYKISRINIPLAEVGYLEGQFITNNIAEYNNPLVLLLPPNPKFKATMNNAIIGLLSNIFLDFNFNVLKINFRGIGKSQGISSANNNEIHDGLAALEWLLNKYDKNKIKTPNTWIAGYGFGGYIGLQLAMRRPEITGFLSIGTPFANFSNQFNMLTPFPNGLIIHGLKDNTTSLTDVQSFHAQLITQNGCQVELELQDNDHYFSDADRLKATVVDYLSQYYLYDKQ